MLIAALLSQNSFIGRLLQSLQDYINNVTKSDDDATLPNPESREIDTTQYVFEKQGLLYDPLLISDGLVYT